MENNNSNEDYSETLSKSAKFNGAISQIYRLDNLWKDTHIHSRVGKLEEWNWDLDRVWLELAGDLDEESKDNEKFIEINKKIGDLKQSLKLGKTLKESFFSSYYNLLNEKELFLRRLQNKLGKGTEYEDEDEDELD